MTTVLIEARLKLAALQASTYDPKACAPLTCCLQSAHEAIPFLCLLSYRVMHCLRLSYLTLTSTDSNAVTHMHRYRLCAAATT